MARQVCCHAMCKNLSGSDGRQWNYSKATFPANFNCAQKIVSETHFRRGFWAHNSNFVKICIALTCKIIHHILSQFWTCHDSWAVMTCPNLWRDWIINLKLKRKEFSWDNYEFLKPNIWSLWRDRYDITCSWVHDDPGLLCMPIHADGGLGGVSKTLMSS